MSEQEPMAQLTQAFTCFGEVLAAWVTKVAEQIAPVMQTIHDAMWQSYRQAGMPYGESHEGLLRWIEDLGEIRKHEQAIERIQEHHDTLICARKLGEKVRAKRR